MDCYIVYLQTGMYEDQREIISKIFSSKESADAYKDKLEKKLKRFGVWYSESATMEEKANIANYEYCSSEMINKSVGMPLDSGGNVLISGPHKIYK